MLSPYDDALARCSQATYLFGDGGREAVVRHTVFFVGDFFDFDFDFSDREICAGLGLGLL